jgi:TonB family protein
VAFQQPSQLTPPVPAKGQERAAELQPQPVTANQMTTAELRDRALPRPAQALSGVVKNIQVSGLSSQGRDELLARLPLREGDSLTPEKFDSIVQSVREFDEHLTVSTHSVKSGEFVLVIRPNNVVPQLAMDSAATLPTSGIKVGQDVQAAKLISHPAPEYPALAKQARISGLVMLAAIIAKDGTVQELKALGGHPLLIQAALDAVKQWVYQPTLLNGAPVEVATTISVTFSLAD